jgi:hypothetical protein
MSNSIWKITNIKPEEDKDIVFMYGSLPTMGCYKNNDDAYIEHATGEIFYGNEVERWAYLADIITQADKAERLQKAVDSALEGIQYIMDYGYTDPDGHYEDLQSLYNKIKQLIKE